VQVAQLIRSPKARVGILDSYHEQPALPASRGMKSGEVPSRLEIRVRMALNIATRLVREREEYDSNPAKAWHLSSERQVIEL